MKIKMNNIQKMGGIAAFYMATAYTLGITLFLFVLNYAEIVDPAQKLTILIEKQMLIYSMNLILYVIFGVFLIMLMLALYERLKVHASAMTNLAIIIGIIWAGSLIASGMVSNAGIPLVVKLYSTDPAQALLTWQQIETVASGLGNGNGEILGGLMTFFISWSALQTGGLPKALNYLGMVVGLVGIVSIAPSLKDLTAVFGVTQIVWFIRLGVILLQSRPSAVK